MIGTSVPIELKQAGDKTDANSVNDSMHFLITNISLSLNGHICGNNEIFLPGNRNWSVINEQKKRGLLKSFSQSFLNHQFHQFSIRNYVRLRSQLLSAHLPCRPTAISVIFLTSNWPYYFFFKADLVSCCELKIRWPNSSWITLDQFQVSGGLGFTSVVMYQSLVRLVKLAKIKPS